MDNHCAQCNKIRALPDSPTKMYMALDHLLDLGHQARPVEAPKDCPYCGGLHAFTDCEDAKLTAQYNKPEPAKPPESATLLRLRAIRAVEEISYHNYAMLAASIEADAQRLKEVAGPGGQLVHWEEYLKMKAYLQEVTERAKKAERERDAAEAQVKVYYDNIIAVNDMTDAARKERDTVRAELAAVKGRLAKLVEAARIVARLHNLPGLLNACTEAETGETNAVMEQRLYNEKLVTDAATSELKRNVEQKYELIEELAQVKRDRAKWVKVCAERDNRIVELCNLVQRIKDYASQHTQYPFANAIIDLCNQVLEPRD